MLSQMVVSQRSKNFTSHVVVRIPPSVPVLPTRRAAAPLAEAAGLPTRRFTLGARDRSSGLEREGVTSTKALTPPRKGRAVLCLIIRALNAPALSTLIRSQMQRSRVRKAAPPKRLAIPRNQSVRLARALAPGSQGGRGQCGQQGPIVILKGVKVGDSSGPGGWRCSPISRRGSSTTAPSGP